MLRGRERKAHLQSNIAVVGGDKPMIRQGRLHLVQWVAVILPGKRKEFSF